MIRAPAESMNQKMGSSSRSATSVIRMIFSTVRAPQDPAFTPGSLATDQRRPTVDQTAARNHAVRRQVSRQRVRQLTVLDERAVVEQQGDPLPNEELVLARQLCGGPVARDDGPISRGRSGDTGRFVSAATAD